jgi:hypothetical protein
MVPVKIAAKIEPDGPSLHELLEDARKEIGEDLLTPL